MLEGGSQNGVPGEVWVSDAMTAARAQIDGCLQCAAVQEFDPAAMRQRAVKSAGISSARNPELVRLWQVLTRCQSPVAGLRGGSGCSHTAHGHGQDEDAGLRMKTLVELSSRARVILTDSSDADVSRRWLQEGQGKAQHPVLLE